jgi:hypothetical protein
MSCPTSKDPNDFSSWEESTDNGTLRSTYDPKGKNAYIVSLSMLASGSAQLGQNMLFGSMLAEFIKEGMNIAYFESRVPGFRTWVKKYCRENGEKLEDLNSFQLNQLAQEYFVLRRVKENGETVPYDRLLALYQSNGCKFLGIYPNAYQDEQSLNYGVLCVYENPIPRNIRKSPILRGIASVAIRKAAKSHKLMKNYFN